MYIRSNICTYIIAIYLPTRRRSCAHVGRCSEQREISNDRDAAATLSLRSKRPKTSLSVCATMTTVPREVSFVPIVRVPSFSFFRRDGFSSDGGWVRAGKRRQAADVIITTRFLITPQRPTVVTRISGEKSFVFFFKPITYLCLFLLRYVIKTRISACEFMWCGVPHFTVFTFFPPILFALVFYTAISYVIFLRVANTLI